LCPHIHRQRLSGELGRLKPIMIIALLACIGVAHAEQFNEYGVWEAVESVELLKGQTTIKGPLYVTDREDEINFGVYGLADGDSLKFTLGIYGGFSPALSDSNKFRILKTTAIIRQVKTTKNYAISDTLFAESKYPYILLRLTNSHADSAITFDVNVFSKEREIKPIRLR